MRIIGPIILFLSSFCFALQKVETKLKSSTSSSSSTISYHYSGLQDSSWTSDVSVTGSRSKVNGAARDIEVTRELQWVNTWDLPYNWFIELGAGGSNTKVNKMRTGNVDVAFGRTNENFYFFNWSLSAGVNNIKQTEGKTMSSSALQLQQSKAGFQLGIEPLQELSLSLFYNKYTYNKDVDQQILLLQNETAVRRYGTAFSDQLSSLIDKESGLILGFKLSETWKLSLNFTQTQDAPEPNVEGFSVSTRLYHKFNSSWDGHVGLGSSQYDSTTTTPETKYSYIGIGAGFSW